MLTARYWCPRTLTEEPRWIGGFLSLRQLGYCAVAAFVEIELVTHLHAKPLGAILLAVAPTVLAYQLGWKRHQGTGEYLDRSLVRWWRYRRSVHVHLYRRR